MQRGRSQQLGNALLFRRRIRRPASDPQPADECRIVFRTKHGAALKGVPHSALNGRELGCCSRRVYRMEGIDAFDAEMRVELMQPASSEITSKIGCSGSEVVAPKPRSHK